MNAKRSIRTLLAILTLALGAASIAPAAASAAPRFRLVRIPGVTFSSPVWVGSAPGSGTMYFVAEQGGMVWSVRGRTKHRFLDLRSRVMTSSEQGLLSIAFSRDYATSGRLYAYFVGKDGNGVVMQYHARNGQAGVGAGKLVLRVPLAPPAATNHNGGNLWAMRDGTLLLSVGDGGGGGVEVRNSQRLNVLMGKLLRITPRATGGYTIPPTNPYRTRAGARKEIYALGLRNPWRYFVDDRTGDIWIGDVGQGEHEEVDVLRNGRPAGANFGWPRMEGNMLFSSAVALTAGRYVRPILTYSHAGGRCSITGGVVYHGPVASMRGRYLYADYCTDRIWSVRERDGRGTVTHQGVGGIAHFATLNGGNVVVASVRNGLLYRIAAPA